MERPADGPTDERCLPAEVVDAWARARRLEWWTLAHVCTVVTAVGLTMGTSQAMKSAWLDDMLRFVPPIAFLLSARYTRRAPDDKFPYGYYAASSIAYLTGALALLGLGAYVMIDSVLHLVHHEKAVIDHVRLFGHPIWRGWLMLAALAWGAVPAFFFGRAKRPLARVLHDKGLLADAEMNRADYIAASAAALGIAGIAHGWWWADAVAAGVIAVEILRDGFVNVKRAVHDLMDRRPQDVDGEEDPLLARVEETVARASWVGAHRVRLREQGHVLLGDVEVAPRTTDGLVDRVEALREELLHLDWRLQEVVVSPVRTVDR